MENALANSKSAATLNPPIGVCRIPARTPGVLGFLDQGDPNVTTLLGDTPGPLGMWDHGDPTLSMFGQLGMLAAGAPIRTTEGVALSVGYDVAVVKPVARDPKLWANWSPPTGYEMLFDLLVKNEGNICHMYLDSKNKVTVGIGTYLPTGTDAKKLRFYNRETQAVATDAEVETDFNAVVAAKPDPKKFPRGMRADAYKEFTKLDMTPTAIGEQWLADVKKFQSYLPAEFSGFATYPADAKQALTDIAYQYGARGAAKTAASGKLKENAEKGDWAAAAGLCATLEGSADRNTIRKQMFEAAAKVAPLPKTPP